MIRKQIQYQSIAKPVLRPAAPAPPGPRRITITHWDSPEEYIPHRLKGAAQTR